MLSKPKAGVALLSAEWYEQIKLNAIDDPANDIGAMARENRVRAVETLSRHFELVHTDIISTLEEARAACDEYRRENVDIIIICSLLYSGDHPIIEIARQMGHLPFLLWSFHPDKKLQPLPTMASYFKVTGCSGMLQGVAPLKRMGVKLGFVLGAPDDDRLNSELEDYARATAVRKALKTLNILSIGRRFEAMTGAWIDEFRMKAEIGPRIDWVSPYELAQTAKEIPDERIRDFVADQKKRYKVVGVPDDAIEAAARASIACYELAHKYNSKIVSVQDMDQEIHDFLGVRPQMTYQPMFEEGIVAGMEQDLDSALCVWMVQELMNDLAMYGEFFTYSEEDDFVACGHASMHDLRFAGDHEVLLIPDGEFFAADRYVGVWDEFIAKPGPVTICGIFEDKDSYHFVTLNGESLESEKFIPGNVHSKIKLNVPIKDLFDDLVHLGVTQHFTMCYGNAKPRIKILADQLGFNYYDLDERYRKK